MYQWIKASFDRSEPGVIVTLHLASATTSWRCDPATGTVTQLPTVAENTNPNSGIGVVIKKNPGSAAP
jgi:lactate dehydrogenase-like 2-hydroxyacid dehydrogenase